MGDLLLVAGVMLLQQLCHDGLLVLGSEVGRLFRYRLVSDLNQASSQSLDFTLVQQPVSITVEDFEAN